jgi:hypothetical protein
MATGFIDESTREWRRGVQATMPNSIAFPLGASRPSFIDFPLHAASHAISNRFPLSTRINKRREWWRVIRGRELLLIKCKVGLIGR